MSDGPTFKVWIDMDNTPHIPFFLPIIRELEKMGHSVVCTFRDAFQVCELAAQKGINGQKIGRHYGKNKLAKLWGLFYRALQLWPFAKREQPDLAVSHGSRSQVLLCNALGLPSLEFTDYEYFTMPPGTRPRWLMVPEVLADEVAHFRCPNVLTYPGIKEDVSLQEFRPNRSVLEKLGVTNGELLVTVRPPATEAHYHNPESELLFERIMMRLSSAANTRTVLLPRNQRQAQWMIKRWPHWFAQGNVLIPSGPIDGLSLLHYSDLVVSGGGTMNREAAALGVPVYSLFRGPIGALDRHLVKQGRLAMVANVDEVDQLICLKKRGRSGAEPHSSPDALNHITASIVNLLGKCH